MTIAAILEITARPGRRDDALGALIPALTATRAHRGNLGVDVLLDDDPDRFLLVERWASAADNEAYQAWRQTPEGAIAGLGEVLAGPPTMRVYPVADS